MRTNFIVFVRVLIYERRAPYCKPFGSRWQGYWTNNMGTTSFSCLYDTFGGLIKNAVIIRFQADTDFLLCHIYTLFDNFGDDTGTDGETTFADGELGTLLKRHRHDQLHRQVHIVSRHHHLHTFRQGDVARHIHRADVELRSIPTEECLVPPTLFLLQHIHLRQKLLVWGYTPRLGQHLSTLHIFSFDAAPQNARIVSSRHFVQFLVEHFRACDDRILRLAQSNNGDRVAFLGFPTIHSSCHHSSASLDREHILHCHHERFVRFALGFRNVFIHHPQQFLDAL